MIDLLDRGWRVWRNNGLVVLTYRGLRFGSRQLKKKLNLVAEGIYNTIKPVTINLSINDTSATFESEPLSYNKYDFIDDFEAEKNIIQDFIESLRQDDIIYDVGANVGIYSCLAAAKDPTPELIIAFEPYPDNAEQLRRNAQLNEGEITVLETALSDRTDKAVLEPRPPTGHVVKDQGDGIKIRIRSAAELVEEGKIMPPTVAKIDVEGNEMEVLNGLQDFIESGQLRLLFLEVHKTNTNSDESIKEFLCAHDYDVSILQVDQNRVHLRAEKIG